MSIDLIELNMIDGREIEDGEDDVTHIRETFKPVFVNVHEIRNFYPRKGDMVGTRIVLKGGSGLPVHETVDQVRDKILSI